MKIDPYYQHLRLLVVDDNPIFLSSLYKYLTELIGFTHVKTAQGGLEALKTATSFQPDIVILDLKMPGMDGIQTAQGLRAAQPDVRIIMVSIQDMAAYREAALSAGADEFISKSEISQHIIAVIRRLHYARMELSA